MYPRSLEPVVISKDWDHQRGFESETTAPKATGVLIGANNGAQGLSPPPWAIPFSSDTCGNQMPCSVHTST